MKITILYFSQTGNTRKLGRAMAEALDGAGHQVKMVSVKKAREDDFRSCDLVATGTPCFSSRAPTPVREFLSRLPDLSGRQADQAPEGPQQTLPRLSATAGSVTVQVSYPTRSHGST